MEGIQLSHTLLEALLVDQSKFTPQIVKQLITWNQQLQPSVNMTQSMISSYLLPNSQKEDDQKVFQQSNQKQSKNQQEQTEVTERLQKTIQDIPKTLLMLQKNKCPKNFLRAFLLFIKKNYNQIEPLIKRQYILDHWSNINPQLLESFCDTFKIKIQKYSNLQEQSENKVDLDKYLFVKSEDFDSRLFELIDKKQYTNSMNLIKMTNCQKEHVNKLLSKMTNNKDSSKAADYIKALKLNPADYPALGERLYKNTARHFLTKNGWEYAEQIFECHPQALACIVQDLVFKHKYPEAISVWYRNTICRQHIMKEETVQYLKPYIQSKGANIKIQEIKANFLQIDDFGPTNRQKYFSLQDFGFRQEQIVWIDQNTKQINTYLKQILQSQILGIDTESIVGQTKFDKSQDSKFQQAALIQISTLSKVFIIDGFTVKHIPEVKTTILNYIQNNGLIVGHTLDNDMDCLLKSLGCSDEQIKSLKNLKVVDIWKLFKAVYPKHRFSSLAFITETMLGKQLCKDQTLTNWQRRPLRRNQIHYAAMDALIVIKIYEKFIEQLGQQMIEYYCSMDANDF